MAQSDRITAGAMRRVGAVVFDGFFGGDVEAVRSRNAKKAMSYAALVKRAPKVGWNEDRIRKAVGAEIVARELGQDIAAKIGYSLLSALYSVDDPAVRRRLAEEIASGELEGVAARLAVAREAKKESHGGRRPKAEADAAIGALERALRKAKRDGAFDEEKLTDMGAAAVPLEKRTRALGKEIILIADQLAAVGRRRRG